MLRSLIIAGVAALLVSGGIATPSVAQSHQHEHHAPAKAAASGECQDLKLACARVVTPVIAPDGRIWAVAATDARAFVAVSSDGGATFSAPVPVHPGELMLDNGPDERPKLAVDRAGAIVVAFATRDKAYNGEAFVTRSADGGATFSPPVKLTTGSPSQRFEVLAFDRDARLFAAWLDKRNVAAAKQKGEKYEGAALAFAWAEARSIAFPPARIARDNTCECCRLGVAFAGPGQPVVIFRNVFEGSVRDHAVITFADPNTPGPVRRVSDDDWRTQACPHHGPSLAVAQDGSYHAAWFTAGKNRKGVFYARSSDAGETFSEPMPIGTAGRQVSRPYLLAQPGRLYLAWKEFDGQSTALMLRVSLDSGATWGVPREVARTKDGSDHPILVGDGQKGFLSWVTRAEGLRLFPLEALL